MFYKGFDKKLKGADKTSSSIVKKNIVFNQKQYTNLSKKMYGMKTYLICS